MINLDKKGRKLILLQRNELLSKKQKYLRKRLGRFIFTNFFINYFQIKNFNQQTENLFKKELETFENYLPENIDNLMDIGCGLGILHIFINQKYKNKPNFFLLDKNSIDLKIKYGFNKNYESYNDLNITKNILLNNGISIDKLNLKDVGNNFSIHKKIDLVISLKSMGYHYPIENYIELLKKTCYEKTVYIFDVFGEIYSLDKVKQIFKEVKIIYEESSLHSLKRLCCSGLY